jgi:PIN domain nuclease of toxin-antitoxin system
MRFLLDTHAWLWALDSPERLAMHVRAAIGEAKSVFVSSAFLWEIAIKHAAGKIAIVGGPERLIVDTRSVLRATELTINFRHSMVAARLPMHHRDPFDRMLVAQATCDDLTLVTADATLRNYGVAILWAIATAEGSP